MTNKRDSNLWLHMRDWILFLLKSFTSENTPLYNLKKPPVSYSPQYTQHVASFLLESNGRALSLNSAPDTTTTDGFIWSKSKRLLGRDELRSYQRDCCFSCPEFEWSTLLVERGLHIILNSMKVTLPKLSKVAGKIFVY